MSSAKSEQAHPILPMQEYLVIGALLLLFTGLTVTIAQFDFGAWNLVIAMLVAGLKATLVALYFMHLKYDHKFYALVFSMAILFLVMFIIFTMFDTLGRDEINTDKSGTIRPNAIIYDDEGRPIPLSERSRLAETAEPGAGQPEEDVFEILHGFGPLKEVIEVGELNPDLVATGRDLFEDKCTDCHTLDDPEVGPPLRDVTYFRSPTFIMNQILDPVQNGEKHPEMQALRDQYDDEMAFDEPVTVDEARALLEYLRHEADQEPEEEETDFTF